MLPTGVTAGQNCVTRDVWRSSADTCGVGDPPSAGQRLYCQFFSHGAKEREEIRSDRRFYIFMIFTIYIIAKICSYIYYLFYSFITLLRYRLMLLSCTGADRTVLQCEHLPFASTPDKQGNSSDDQRSAPGFNRYHRCHHPQKPGERTVHGASSYGITSRWPNLTPRRTVG